MSVRYMTAVIVQSLCLHTSSPEEPDCDRKLADRPSSASSVGSLPSIRTLPTKRSISWPYSHGEEKGDG
uniref:Putative secreted protein n=1 Tax=Anopheles marajoara TaxID=58244 RepID=A0A2M4CEV3_9DIPT